MSTPVMYYIKGFIYYDVFSVSFLCGSIDTVYQFYRQSSVNWFNDFVGNYDKNYQDESLHRLSIRFLTVSEKPRGHYDGNISVYETFSSFSNDYFETSNFLTVYFGVLVKEEFIYVGITVLVHTEGHDSSVFEDYSCNYVNDVH